MPKLRRVVTGHNEKGKSIILFDGVPPNSEDNLAELWRTVDRAPNGGNAEAGGLHREMEAPEGGTLFRHMEIPPGFGPKNAEEFRAALKEMNALHALGDQSRHPGMHRTNSIDYIVVLTGRLTLIVEEGEVELGPFDMVVQRGTAHAWENRGTETARIIAVNINTELL